jgi:hypothetical protein
MNKNLRLSRHQGMAKRFGIRAINPNAINKEVI